MIKPTVGRKVWYHASRHDRMGPNAMVTRNQPLDATIVYVHSDRYVNVVVFDAIGNMHRRMNVRLKQEDSLNIPPSYVEWMPYQTNQAKKAEAAQ